MRIVSLVPSVTETLSAWGRTPMACTRYCERPDLAHVGGTKNPDIEKISELRPDLVVVDAEENRREDYDALVERDIDVLVLHVRSLADVNPAMAHLADRVQAQWEPVLLPTPQPIRTRAFIPIWRRPWIALGVPTYGASLLAQLGSMTIFDSRGSYPEIDLAEAIAHRPDVVLAPDEPYPFSQRHRRELESVAPTTFVDGKDLFWWGVRTTDALTRLAPLVASLSH